ncbi:DNA photolyase, FAD-binding/Cryptochrome [Trametes maxima]|nr:DNA photolyase, FAD-binding/Cryptochrome [Trametes maxima]
MPLPPPLPTRPLFAAVVRVRLPPMTKRARSTSPTLDSPAMKKSKEDAKFLPNKIATVKNAASVDASPPVFQLVDAVCAGVKNPAKGDCIVYWMRMEDMRIRDNRALAQASAQARKDGVPLITLFVLSPQDYAAHDRSPRRIDFTLRNLKCIKDDLARLDVPLYTVSHTPRTKIPSFVYDLMTQWKASHIFGNIEYEVDELRRDLALCQIAKKQGKVVCTFVHDKCIVPPGDVRTKEGKGYTVYSPFLRSWAPVLEKASSHHLNEAPPPQANNSSVHQHAVFGKFFKMKVPNEVEGFTMEPEERDRISTFWPAGEGAAHEMLSRFLNTAARSSQFGAVDPLTKGAKQVDPTKQSRLGKYKDARDRMDSDTTSRLSPYLAAGIVSARACVREALAASSKKKLDVSRDTGVGRWIQELAWRDFYTHIVALFPRVSMGRPFQEKYAGVRWETDAAHLQAWKDGRTGVPIVDAAMRQARTMGWMHNRARMIAAMYLVKDLMIDWRLGEQVRVARH